MEKWTPEVKAGLTLLLSALLVTFLFWLIRRLLSNNRRGFIDFLVGDTGKLSIARLQAVVWAFVIIVFQVSVLLALLLNSSPDVQMKQFTLEFSESILWLLGLSLTSYVAVKGITVHHISRGEQAYKRYHPRLADLITGENGLDFSKFQMLIWTLLALFVYLGSAYNFISEAHAATTATRIAELFNTDDSSTVLIPDIDGSFIVLMGMSQGVYVGKKLIPSFQLDGLRASKQQELIRLKLKLQERKAAYESILENFRPVTDADHLQKASLQRERDELNRQLSNTEATLEEINQYITI